MRLWIIIAIVLPWQASGQIIPFGSTWKYFDLESEPPNDSTGLFWTEGAYLDDFWASGPAQLGYGDDDEATVINSSTLTGYFRYQWTDLMAGDYGYIRLSLVYDDGAVIYLNGTEVWRVNMPAGPITYNTFASSNSGDNATASIVLANTLTNGVNTVAVEVHQRSATSSDLSFDFQIEYLGALGDPIIGFHALWKYYDLAQMPPDDDGNVWISLPFDDTEWPEGPAQLGYGDGDEATVINSNCLTAYFRKEFTTISTFAGVSISLLYDDGAVIYIDGEEISRVNMPDGVIEYNTFATGTVSDNSVITMTIPFELMPGTHVIAAEVHQASATSSDLSFDFSLGGLSSIPVDVIRGPYLQSGSHDRMTIRWRTGIPTQSWIRYGTVPGLLHNVTGDTSLTTEHTVEITGLMAGTKYYYTIEDEAQFVLTPSADLFFTTSPSPGSLETVRAWILGDCGTGNHNARAVRDAYYNFIGDTHTDLILLLGDNAYDDGTDEEYQKALFENMYEDKLKNTQLWPCLGNHDGHSASSSTQTGPYYDIFTLPVNGECGGTPSGTEAYYSFEYGNVHFIVLDSYDSDRNVGGPMYTWCENDIQNATAKWIIAFWHHPAYSKGSHNSDTETRLVQMRTNFIPMLEENGVDLVLSGHSHSYERSFYINGHYGLSSTFDAEAHTVGATGDGDGRLDGDGAYQRMQSGEAAGDGMVYVTAGSSGKLSDGPLNHPAMYYSVKELGSCYIEITNNELSLSFIRTSGAVDDYFTIRKVDESCTPGEACDDGNPCTINAVYTADCFCAGSYVTSKVVTSAADEGPGSLRNVIQSACNGDTITFDPAITEPIILQSQIHVNIDLAIIGSNAMNILSGGNQDRIFLLETGSTLRLKNLILADGASINDGGAMLVQGILVIDHVEFSNNYQDGIPRAITNQGLVRVEGGTSVVKE